MSVDPVAAGQCFVDRNVWLYAVIEDAKSATKSATARAVVADVFLRTTRLTAPDAAIRAFAESCRGAERLPTLHAMLDALHEQVGYDTTTTGSATTAAEAFADKRGVCQDHAHIFIAAARVLGIPARYVTGYLLVDAGEDSGAVAGDGASAVAHHAWAEALVADIGWIGFDPSNGQCPTDRYVRLAVGLDAAMAAPIRGVHAGAARESLDVAVEVRQSQSQSQKQQ